jgi:anaerobic ribonucleoside-triphosphate reductase activating protein
MKIIRIDKDNMLNGDGLRAVVWTSGCSHHCPGCHNPETWDYDYGHVMTTEEKEFLLNYLSNSYVAGVTFSGGDPLFSQNRDGVLELCKKIKETHPSKNIWVYTGFTLEYLEREFPEILKYVDVLVDGPFVQSLADIKYHWAGSTNQRVIKLGGRLG